MKERADLGFDDGLGLRDRRLARVDALAHRGREIVDGIEEYVLHPRHLGFDVPRHGEVHHENGAVTTRAHRALHRALADDRQRACSAGDDDVVLGQPFGQVAQLERLRVEAARQRLGSLEGAVCDRHCARPLRGKVSRSELDHLARADQEHFLLGKAGENPSGELDRRGGHRDDVGADSGAAAHLLRHRKGALEQLVEQRSERAGGFGDASRLFHLAQDLRLADHHGIEARGDAERVPHGFGLRKRIEIGFQLPRLDAVIAREPLERRLRLAQRAVKLGAIAGGENRSFLDRLAGGQLRKRRTQTLGVKRHPLSDGERSGMVIQTEREKLHGAGP